LGDYKVYIDASAEQDLSAILSYIALTLKEPAAAKRIYSSIKEKILSLRQMPERHSIVNEEPFAQQGVRMLLVENYIAFYIITDAKEVHVFRILYNRREWQSILSNSDK
jgi:plasmid stabilization system protein ParE